MKQGGNQDIMFEATLKSVDTEDPVDLAFYRPVGYHWAQFFHKLGIAPNTVTIISIFVGVLAGVFLYFENIWYNLAGMLLLVCAHLLDCTDGQLARMTGRFSRSGRILDRFSGCAWSMSVYAMLCLRLMNSGWDLSVFFLALIAGYFHLMQASVVDYYRNFHLLFLKGKSACECELEDKKQLHLNFKRLSWKNEFIKKLLLFFYLQYTVSQERFTPDMQELRRLVRVRFDDNIPDWLRMQFREKSASLMKYNNLLSFNMRVITLFITLLLNEVWFYFVFELTVLNGVLFYVIYKHEKMCRYFIEKLNRI